MRASDAGIQGDAEAIGAEAQTQFDILDAAWVVAKPVTLQREALIRRIHQALADGGVLVVTEKVLSNARDLDRDFIDFYYAYKGRTGYSQTEIHKKRMALENVLVPYRIDENKEMFRRNGFRAVDSFFQWFNFVGFLCGK